MSLHGGTQGVYSVRQDPADRSCACVHPESATNSRPLFRLALHQQGAEVVASSPGGSWTKVIARPTVTQMGNRRLDARAFGLLVTLLVLIGAAFLWMRGRRWTDHDVSDPGVAFVGRPGDLRLAMSAAWGSTQSSAATALDQLDVWLGGGLGEAGLRSGRARARISPWQSPDSTERILRVPSCALGL